MSDPLDGSHTAPKFAAPDPGRIEPEPKDAAGHGMREFHLWDPAGNLIGFGAALKET